MSLLQELRRRNVFRVGVAYVLAAWVLLQVVDFVLGMISAPEWILRVFFLAAAAGLPLVLIFSWVFEVTPEGIKRESQIDRTQSITPQTGRKLDRAIIGILVVAVALLLLDRFVDRPGPDSTGAMATAQVEPGQVGLAGGELKAVDVAPAAAGPPSIAVLPFVNMSADPQNEYFSDGVAEEILNALARIPGLKVTARTSAFTYKGSKAGVAQIAKELGVNHILEGSVRKEGNQVRVTAQLIEANNSFHMWSETYDRELTNIFAIQDEIAQAIAAAMKVELLPATENSNLTGTTNLEAYEYYLQGVSQWHIRTGESLQTALGLFEKAAEIDPSFARAHAYQALTWAILADYTDFPMPEAFSNARKAAETALALDPQSIEAATALINTTNDLRQGVEYARQAIALNPGFATTHQWYATALVSLGDFDGAEREYRIAQELDPRSRINLDNLALMYIYRGDLEAAERTALQVEAIAPDWPQGQERLFMIYLLRGDREQAERAGNRLAAVLGRKHNATPVYLDLLFNPERKAAAVAEIAAYPLDQIASPDNPALIEAYDVTLLLAVAGANHEALETLEWSRRNDLISSWGFMRTVRIVPDFVCSPEVQAFYASTDLPPLVEPYPCPP
jgi:TolB-like protein/Tfp pilus assembly protein PilF